MNVLYNNSLQSHFKWYLFFKIKKKEFCNYEMVHNKRNMDNHGCFPEKLHKEPGKIILFSFSNLEFLDFYISNRNTNFRGFT